MRGKKGHNKLKPAKVKFFADHANYRFKHGLTLGRFLSASRKETLLHAGIVDTQEFVLGGGHVDEIGLAFGPFLVQELVYRLVSGGLEQIGTDDLVKCLAQVGRTPLGGRIALGNVLAGLVYRRINAGETYNGAGPVRKFCVKGDKL